MAPNNSRPAPFHFSANREANPPPLMTSASGNASASVTTRPLHSSQTGFGLGLASNSGVNSVTVSGGHGLTPAGHSLPPASHSLTPVGHGLPTATGPRTPSTGSSGNHTYMMSASPVRKSKTMGETYRPKIVTTVGAKPACLVNASVTYVGNDQIYAFGGFDQYTDEVYNHVLRLDLKSRQWNLVDNFGDIPGVRMGHTACFWRGNKLLVFGGENEHRSYLSDVIEFDLTTATWTQPVCKGQIPKGRARHAAVIHDDKMFIIGGMTGTDNYVLDEICYLDLQTWTWSRSWRFVSRYDHTAWVWGGRIWVFGGIGEESERSNELWWLDLRGSMNSFESSPETERTERRNLLQQRSQTSFYTPPTGTATSSTGHVANSSSMTTGGISRAQALAPGSISSIKFMSSPNLPVQSFGAHFHIYSSGCLLDLVTPTNVVSSFDTSLSALDLDTLSWRKLADGRDLFHPNYRWHYCTMNEEGTQAWLLGTPSDAAARDNGEEYLSDVLPIDLRKLGLVGNDLAADYENNTRRMRMPASDSVRSSHLSGIGADLARTFDTPPESGSGTDFIVTGEQEEDENAAPTITSTDSTPKPSQPIHVHKLILQARWPHFQRLYSSQMLEFQTKKMHIPEPYSSVRAFLYYLYTDSIAPHPQHGPTLNDVAGMLVMANMYDMPRLRDLCAGRLFKELDITHAATIWERAGIAGEDWLRRSAASFIARNLGEVLRSPAMESLGQASLLELLRDAVSPADRVVTGDEFDKLREVKEFGVGGGGPLQLWRKRKGPVGTGAGQLVEEETGDEEGDEGMDVS